MVFVVSNGKKIYKGKLPTHKELSLINVFWNMRNDLSIYGCGICEIMRQDKNLLDKIRNMSVDQLVLSIYKMFFYDGTLNSEDAQIKLKPGRGIRVLDPSKVKWLEVPSGGAEAYSREALLRENIEESTGISKALTGVLNSDPNVKALALQQAKESALAKLRSPLDNILSALAREARIRWSLIQELNMFPEEVHKLYDPEEISAYLEEINHNAELFYHDPTEGAVYALKYPEIAANLTVDKNGVYKASQERAFFNVTPDMIRWDGEITFSAEAILVVNKELQKQMDLDMANLLIPLFSGDPNLLLKPAKQILKIYGKDEADWLPDAWLHPSQFAPQAQPIGPGGMGPQSEVQPTDQGQNPQTQPNQVPGLPRVVSERETQPGSGTTDIVNKMVARTQNPAI